uniref:(California timema) hypothetical protein n=1 Tax=Timema californicum TaxID=61474 RepID=A0A7R9PDR4_TIMCA|nr:unnamed protein product [Timema californicum]
MYGKSGYRVKRKLALSDASNILQPAATKQKTDQRETFLVAKNDTTNFTESSKADLSEENLNKSSKNIDTSATTEENANQLNVFNTDKTDTKNQAADGNTPKVRGIHRSGSRSDESSSSSSSSESSSSRANVNISINTQFSSSRAPVKVTMTDPITDDLVLGNDEDTVGSPGSREDVLHPFIEQYELSPELWNTTNPLYSKAARNSALDLLIKPGSNKREDEKRTKQKTV